MYIPPEIIKKVISKLSQHIAAELSSLKAPEHKPSLEGIISSCLVSSHWYPISQKLLRSVLWINSPAFLATLLAEDPGWVTKATVLRIGHWQLHPEYVLGLLHRMDCLKNLQLVEMEFDIGKLLRLSILKGKGNIRDASGGCRG